MVSVMFLGKEYDYLGTKDQLDRMLNSNPNQEIELYAGKQRVYARVSEVWADRNLNTPKTERK